MAADVHGFSIHNSQFIIHLTDYIINMCFPYNILKKYYFDSEEVAKAPVKKRVWYSAGFGFLSAISAPLRETSWCQFIARADADHCGDCAPTADGHAQHPGHQTQTMEEEPMRQTNCANTLTTNTSRITAHHRLSLRRVLRSDAFLSRCGVPVRGKRGWTFWTRTRTPFR